MYVGACVCVYGLLKDICVHVHVYKYKLLHAFLLMYMYRTLARIQTVGIPSRALHPILRKVLPMDKIFEIVDALGEKGLQSQITAFIRGTKAR